MIKKLLIQQKTKKKNPINELDKKTLNFQEEMERKTLNIK